MEKRILKITYIFSNLNGNFKFETWILFVEFVCTLCFRTLIHTYKFICCMYILL